MRITAICADNVPPAGATTPIPISTNLPGRPSARVPWSRRHSSPGVTTSRLVNTCGGLTISRARLFPCFSGAGVTRSLNHRCKRHISWRTQLWDRRLSMRCPGHTPPTLTLTYWTGRHRYHQRQQLPQRIGFFSLSQARHSDDGSSPRVSYCPGMQPDTGQTSHSSRRQCSGLEPD